MSWVTLDDLLVFSDLLCFHSFCFNAKYKGTQMTPNSITWQLFVIKMSKTE